MVLQSPRYQCVAVSWTRLNRSAANPVPLCFSQMMSWDSRQPASANSPACCRNIRMDPKHHMLFATSAATLIHPSGHRSHFRLVSP